jgi:hypothetical protein
MLKGLQIATSFAMLCGFALLSGCKASEAQPAGFIENPEYMTRDATTPFQRIYWNKKYDKNEFDEVIVAPVNMKYVAAQNFWEEVNVAALDKEKLKKDILEVGEYTRNSFIRAFTNDPNKRFKVVTTPGPRALNAVGYVTWIPTAVASGASIATESPDSGKGYVAIEGRVRKGDSGEIIGMFADRENPPTALVDVKALSWWAPAKQIIDNWSKDLVLLANRRPGEVVKGTPAFQLLVW